MTITKQKKLDFIKTVENKYRKYNLPHIKTGDNIQIKLIIQEGSKERIQISEGIVIAKHNRQLNTTITVRKVVQNIGVERIYLVHSPNIIEIKIINHSKIRRSKLYYLRKRSGKATRLKIKLSTP
uniref:Ribosomal protein L19 n=1 Tax=Nitophyllum punctatum TaxID=158729 RepID=A0A4D6WVJ0_9FLOR|nr:ribosomal protein L19 [Nitophyllum punctatum]